MNSKTRDWLLFTGWFLAGACDLLGLLTALTIGIFILPVSVAGTVLLATRRDTQRGLPGAIAGVSMPLFLLTYVNRHGPGTYCTSSAGGGSCTDGLLNPWLLLAAGLLLLGAGVVLFLKTRQPVAGPNATSTERGESLGA